MLLKNVQFIDQFSDISCDSLRDALYNSRKSYDYVVISQHWIGYNENITNTASSEQPNYTLEKWRSFLADTITHFLDYTDRVVIIGGHLLVEGTAALQPTVFLTQENYLQRLRLLEVINRDKLEDAHVFFGGLNSTSGANVIHPNDVFCPADCKLHDGEWSFFADRQHLSSASTPYVSDRLRTIGVAHVLGESASQ